MKLFRMSKLLVLVCVLSLLVPATLPLAKTEVAYAATVKLTKKALTLETGKTSTLKITGTSAKVTWSSSNKAVATVSTKGVVSAKKAGTATITATVNKKKYTCKVTVKKPVVKNPYIEKAPFAAMEFTAGQVKGVIPNGWKSTVVAEQGNSSMHVITPADAGDQTSSVSIMITETGADRYDYPVLKELLTAQITQDYLLKLFEQQGLTAEITDFKTSDYEATLGTAFKTEYQVTVNDILMTQMIYDISLDNYMIEITVTQADGDTLTPSVTDVGAYLLNSIQIVK